MPTRTPTLANFRHIRAWDGSQDRAFEELCFQLRDPTPPGALLIKTSAPDAGVEWYWQHSDGTQHGWQVKFIFSTDSLLQAMKDSLRAAATKRPNLRQLTFCIPYDLADDPSRARGRQAREKFEAATRVWQTEWPHVRVALVTGGLLLERLASEEHRGREWFFFGERVLGSEWCRRELQSSIDDAGARYTPEQDVALPIDDVLEAIALPEDVGTQFFRCRDAALRAARKLLASRSTSSSWAHLLQDTVASLRKLEHASVFSTQPPAFARDAALGPLRDASIALQKLMDALHRVAWPERAGVDTNPPHAEPAKAAQVEEDREATAARFLYNTASGLESALIDLESFLDSPLCQAAEKRALFVEGMAGSGKTHLFCDVGSRLAARGHPVLLVLGQRFIDQSPWTTIARFLGEPGLSPDEVATVLASSGEASGRRAIVLIDALNESERPSVWASELPDIRRRLTATGWVGLGVSCRTTYLDLVEPAGGPDEQFVHVQHAGYGGREFEATATIFAAHGVREPKVPLLTPEFNNPLFLKMYCEGLRDAALPPPSSSEHLSAVFKRFVQGRQARVEKALRLDPRLDIVGQAIQALANAFAAHGRDRLPYRAAHSLVNAFAPHLQVSPMTLIETMASEGLLSIERDWLPERDTRGEVVAFPYQRFSDHLVLEAILHRRLGGANPDQVTAAFGDGGELSRWLQEAPAGLIEALAIQLPERWGLELLDILPRSTEQSPRASWRRRQAWTAFADSIVLRDRTSFTPRTAALVNEGLRIVPSEVAASLISVAPDPSHPYNGAKLHAFLSDQTMAERDAFWTMLNYSAFGDHMHPLDRLVRWAARGPYPDYPSDVVGLACIPLVWQLASPNRYGRDYTTKALATVLQDRAGVCQSLINAFESVDDPYVIQRLVAAILGAVTRSGRPPTPDEGTALVEALLGSCVESSARAPDILVRDYVASLARWLESRDLLPSELLARAVPPYGSKPPKVPRSEAYLKQTFPSSDGGRTTYGSLCHSALSRYSDWSHYVVSERMGSFLPLRLGAAMPSVGIESGRVGIAPQAWEGFLTTLDAAQAQLAQVGEAADFSQLVDSLDESQRRLLREICAYGGQGGREPVAFPAERARRFVFQRCIELGWSPELFGAFDSSRRSIGRESRKPERFGKKYQWIALFELLARLADNFIFCHWREVASYQGAWQLHLRDMDPTLPPERIVVGDGEGTPRTPTFPSDRHPAWWTPREPDFGRIEPDEAEAWAARNSDLPTPQGALRTRDPHGRDWLVLEGYYNWRDDLDASPSVDADEGPTRDLAILVSGVFVHRHDLPALRDWLRESPDLLRSLPSWHSGPIAEAFWSELPMASQSFDYADDWQEAAAGGELPVPSARLCIGYSCESGHRDCSLTETVTADLPSRLLHRLGRLEWRESLNAWTDHDGVPRAQYRQTDEGFHRDRVFMIAEDHLAQVLHDSRLAVALGLFCERRVFAGSSSSMPKSLGWVDYVGHLVFDGDAWEEVPLRPFRRVR